MIMLSIQLSTIQRYTTSKQMSPPDARLPFPTYLLPTFAFPFRRRQSSTSTATSSSSPPSLSYSPTSSASTSPSSSPPTTHFLPKDILHSALQSIPEKPKVRDEGEVRLHRAQPNTLKCVTCSSDIAFADQIVSKGFTGRHGRAYLVSLPPVAIPVSGNKNQEKDTGMLPNTRIGRSVNRELLTGQHVVADVSCVICGVVLGWKYLDAKELAQKYKIGKYILEMKRVVLAVGWEDAFEDGEEVSEDLGGPNDGGKEGEDEDVVVFDSEDEDECEDLFAGTWDPEVVAKRRGKRTWTRKKATVDV
ncbi:yippee zinc-binding/DNA-binding /Mis18, centromere assembly-domain-containing protein [Leptodontidium sp. MPI-SDFR-AT-0119]|nr:yippee zinc-binding/DNA-binding /Mis18, centromere assembly-domain-containing protein [Leptodontidium sp. MPI-SDFR-AT-0119]